MHEGGRRDEWPRAQEPRRGEGGEMPVVRQHQTHARRKHHTPEDENAGEAGMSEEVEHLSPLVRDVEREGRASDARSNRQGALEDDTGKHERRDGHVNVTANWGRTLAVQRFGLS